MNFNREVYKLLNSDLDNENKWSDNEYRLHYMLYGIREGRKCSITDVYPDFNYDIYRNNYADLKNMTNIELGIHWLNIGLVQKRSYNINIDTKRVISPHLMGGLCNQMFQIASAYGEALKTNKIVTVTTLDSNPHSSIDYFSNIFRRVKRDTKLIIKKIYNETIDRALQYCDIPNIDSDMRMIGYFQNEKYFIKYRKEILDLFSIEPIREEVLRNNYNDLDNSYFIHIRRGDYVNNRLHYIDLTMYYKKCIEYIKSIDNNANFYVFSNDIEYCKSLEWLNKEDVRFIQNLDELDSLYLMSMCKSGGICCNSSYSWWAGYLNKNEGKTVIYPNKWFNNDWNIDIGWKGCKIMNIVDYTINNNCIVTAYYNIKSKFSNHQYLEWITNFMNTVKADVILYTSSDMLEYFTSFNKSNVTIIVKEFIDLYYYKYYEVFRKQWEMDKIKERRSPELFILWYNKLRFLEETSILYGKRYTNYIWCDIGVFREMEYLEVRKNFGMSYIKSDKPILLQLRDVRESDLRLYEDHIYGNMNDTDVFLGGGIIPVPLNYIDDLIILQESVMKRLILSNRFYGCDQRCYAYMYSEKPEMFNLIRPSGNCDPWFYLLDYLS
jgi:hypothetical protein